MIRIFVGCCTNNEDLESQSVLEWSLRKHHPADDIEIVWMQLSRDPASFWYSDPARGLGWNTAEWATPFSPFRFAIPAYCKFEGRAIYMDSDMIAMADIAELWNQPFQDGKAVISKGENDRYCVSLFDCARMKALVPPLDQLRRRAGLYRSVRGALNGRVQKFAGNWNCLDGNPAGELDRYKSLNDPDIKVLHYTVIPTQLQLKHALPRLAREGGRHWYAGKPKPHPRADFQKLFDDLLAEAIASGYPPERYRKQPFGEFRARVAA